VVKCKECGEEKKIEAKGLCRSCYDKKEYQINKIKIIKKQKLYYQKNKEERKLQQNKYYQKNKEKIKENYHNNINEMREKSRKDYQKNITHNREREKKNYRKNIVHNRELNNKNYQKRKEYFKIYNKIHKDRMNLTQRNCHKRRYNVDIDYTLRTLLRDSVRRIVTEYKGKKLYKSLDLLGCTIIKYRNYIEKQWLPGMDWSNHTKTGWHIDHIIPLSAFDLTKPEEQLKAFNYKNIQPLWAKDNLSKGNKLDWKKNQ